MVRGISAPVKVNSHSTDCFKTSPDPRDTWTGNRHKCGNVHPFSKCFLCGFAYLINLNVRLLQIRIHYCSYKGNVVNLTILFSLISLMFIVLTNI